MYKTWGQSAGKIFDTLFDNSRQIKFGLDKSSENS
jgi:hypothetical protein